MKKFLVCGIFVLILLTFCGCSEKECEHLFSAATCQAPSVCSLCGKTEGNRLPHNYKNQECTLCGRLTRTAEELQQYVKENKRALITSITDITDNYQYICKSALRAKGDRIYIQITLENYDNSFPASDPSLQECANLVLMSLEDRAVTIKERIIEFKSIYCKFYDKNKKMLFSTQTGKLSAAEKYVAKNREYLNTFKNNLTSLTEINCTSEIVADGNAVVVNIVLSDLINLDSTSDETAIDSIKQSFQPHLYSLLATLRSEVPELESFTYNIYTKEGTLLASVKN